MTEQSPSANHLAGQSSPYLLQHVGNPVDWYPWGREAFNKARQEDKPIFLSIGYSACHWCHVMAHESFEDVEIAGYLNDNFVSIKVDREERPDVDHVYMQAVQALTGRGGWPLSVFLTPDGVPFFGGTYFPPEASHGLPGFGYILQAMNDAYRQDKKDIEKHGAELQAALARALPEPVEGLQGENSLNAAFAGIMREFDGANGGFGNAPKFPEATALEFVLRIAARKGDRRALDLVELTLSKMAAGGLYDQLGGGFHRYSVDNQWRIPHFEKMLYDNAQLASLYVHAYQATHNELYKRIACETLDFLLREMRSAEGGFYSSQDADSEGAEGKYYTWTADEIRRVVGNEAAGRIMKFYGATEAGNFEGRNVFHITGRIEEPDAIQEARAKLLSARQGRAAPAKDTKVVTSWNGLAMLALSEAAAAFGGEDYLAAAGDCAALIERKLQSGRLTHILSGRPDREVYLEDYAMTILGLLGLQSASFSLRHLETALSLAATMVADFVDEADGLMYDTPGSGEKLFIRPRNVLDSPVPSGGSCAVEALLRLSAITGDSRYREVAQRLLRGLKNQMESFPRGFGNWLCALAFLLSPGLEVVVAGKPGDRQSRKLISAIHDEYLPDRVMCCYDPEADKPSEKIGLLQDRSTIRGKATVYLCKQTTCLAPITDVPTLARALEDMRPSFS